MSRDIQDIIYAAEYPEEPVVVSFCSVAGEIEIRTVWPFREVSLHVAIVISPDSAEHRWPWLSESEQSTTYGNHFGVHVEKLSGVTRQRRCRAARFCLGNSGQWRDDDCSRLGLPTRVNYGTAIATYVLAIPHPCFGIDRLTDRSKKSKHREIMLCGILITPLHECSDRGRCSVENRDAVALADFPEAIFFRPIRCAFVHHARGAVRERTVYEIRMSRHPAHIGCAPENVVVAQVENFFRRR